MIFVLKPRKSQKVEELMAPPVSAEFRKEADSVPDPGQEATKKTLPAVAKPTAAVRKPADAPPQAIEDVSPLIPEGTPLLDMKVQETTASSAAQPAGNSSEARDEATGGQENTTGSPAVKIKAGDIVPLESVDEPPQIIKRVEPVYPAVAMTMKAEISVTLNALISESGDVLQTAVAGAAKGLLGFDKAAESAVRKWKFRPARKDGVNVRVWKPLTIGFILKKQG